MDINEYTIEVGGKTLTAQFTNLADQANGSVIVRYGNTTILATATMGAEREGMNYFPLSVEYEEKHYAAGAILGSRFQRREGRPSEEAVLSARVVDRTIRPLFDQSMRRDVQVIITVLSIDEDDADVLGVIGASLALGTSNIPWGGPVSAVRLGRVNENDDFIINPIYSQRIAEQQTLDLLACGKDGNVNMIEVGANEAGEEVLQQGLERAVAEMERIQQWQAQIIAEVGKEKEAYTPAAVAQELVDAYESFVIPKLEEAVFGESDGTLGKKRIGALQKEWVAHVAETLESAHLAQANDYFDERLDAYLHEEALNNNRRADGRAFDQIRPLFAQAGGISPMLHGVGVFYRGGTHVLSALTLGGPDDAQLLDTIESQDTQKRFMHHYNFPPFSVGETGRVGGFNRRMIGHGALAEKALVPVLPAKDVFPYTIRIVSESMASNGSTSMASVCGSTLALMDAGVPITRPVAGIAMGMMSNEAGDYKILTDIQGPEDHHGDMDFKVAGTRAGVTAVQMDVKVSGVPVPVLVEAFAAAKKAREQILDVIETEISEPRADINARAPKIMTLTVKEDQIGLVIGPGGKTINGIKDATGVTDITIEDDGSVYITGTGEGPQRAHDMIAELTHEYTAGERFEGEVTRILDFGAFVKIGTNTEGLVHISEIAPFRIKSVEEVLSVGERVPVIIKEIDEKDRINLSIKAVDAEFAAKKGVSPAATPDNHAKGEHTAREQRD